MILQEFNQQCREIADNFEVLARNNPDDPMQLTLALDSLPIDIELWWAIGEGDSNYKNKNYRALAEEKRRNPDQYQIQLKKNRAAFAKNYPNMSRHFNAMNLDDWREEINAATYFPHVVEYAYPDFITLDGFQRLNQLCYQMGGVAMDVALEVNDKAKSLFAEDAYHFIIVFRSPDDETILEKAQKLDKKPFGTKNLRPH